MGLVIHGTHVVVDHACKDWLVTEPAGNPTEEWVGELRIWSVFRRRLASAKLQRDRRLKMLGDNCPIIYALKGKQGLTTDLASILHLSRSFDVILDDIANRDTDGYDAVISMPSSHPLSAMVATRFARKFSAPHLENVFRKITVEEALTMLDRADIDVADHKRLAFRIGKQLQSAGFHGAFSLKDIPVVFRHVFTPLKINAGALSLTTLRVLLVDDLLATGTTMVTAAELIRQTIPRASICGACLFGSAGR